MSAVELLCEIIAQGRKGSATAYAMHPDFEMLLREGFVRKVGVVQSVACLECDTPHDAEIANQDGSYGFFCPELGYIQVARNLIEAVEPDFSTIVAGLADAFDCKRRKSTPLQGATWRIGTIASESGDVSLYLHPSLRGEQEAASLSAALSSEIRSPYRLILTAVGKSPIPDAKIASLADVLELHSEQTGFAVVADPRDIVEAPRKNPGGAPNRHKETLVPLIQSRMRDGSALPGRNEEAKAVLAILREQGIHAKLPSLSSVNDYVTKCRGG